MIKLEKPDFDQGEILDACMSNMRTGEGKPRARIEASRDAIIAESDRYDRLAESGKLNRIKRHSLVDGGATKRIWWNYMIGNSPAVDKAEEFIMIGFVCWHLMTAALFVGSGM